MPKSDDKNELDFDDLVSNDDQAVLEVQVNMQAYSKVVQKRVIDDISQECRFRLEAAQLEVVDEAVRAQVCSKVEEYMREKPQMQSDRIRLQKSIRKLQEAATVEYSAI